MNYPLQLSFEILAIGRKLSVTDSNGNLIFYVKQKMFKLKESVTIFADVNQTMPLYTMNADRVLDFSASYHFADNKGVSIGAVRRKGMRSLWKARYDILNGGGPAMTIQEVNPWSKVLDALFCEIPIVGMLSGYVFHPEYVVARQDGTAVMRLKKEPAFFQGKFSIEKIAILSEQEETRVLLSLIMMVLLERQRG
jgi:uncharacterized protein YxjI